MPSQQHPDIPYVSTITGFEEPLCQFEIQNRLRFAFAICERTGPRREQGARSPLGHGGLATLPSPGPRSSRPHTQSGGEAR